MTPEVKIRMLRYRLNRQGMLELDAWLAPLIKAEMDDPALVEALEMLLDREPPELEAMMRGETEIPAPLRPYLAL